MPSSLDAVATSEALTREPRMRKTVVGVEQLFEPRVTIEHHHIEPRARLRVARNVEIVLPLSQFDKWIGEAAGEFGRAAFNNHIVVDAREIAIPGEAHEHDSVIA